MTSILQRRPDLQAQAQLTGDEKREYEQSRKWMYTDGELGTLVMGEVRRSWSDYNTSISKQRERAYSYYYGQPFGNERRGFSRHVSMEVFDTVQATLSKLMNTFTASDEICYFPALENNDVMDAKVATRYVNEIFSKRNPGFKNLHDIFFDGLVAKLATVKRYWCERTVVEQHRVDKVPFEVFQAFMGRDGIDLVEIGEDTMDVQQVMTPYGPVRQMQRLISATITQKKQEGNIKIEVMPPEDVFISTWANDPNEADFIACRYEKTKGQMIAEGFDPNLVDKMSYENTLDELGAELARHSVDDSWKWTNRDGKGEMDLVRPIEAYLDIDMDGDGIPELWKITCDNTNVLDKEMVSEKPFNFWCPYEVAHKSIGLSSADVTTDLQRTSSGLVRGAVDNVFLTNTSQKAADLSTIRNPRDLIENPIGVVIDTPNPEKIAALPQPQLNPQTFNLYEILKQQKEERTGQSRLSQGMNGNAVSKQNSWDLINSLMLRGDDRTAFMARSFAERCFKPLLLAVYRLGVEYKQVVPMEVDGAMQDVNPEQFKQREEMKVAVALTQDERLDQAQSLANYGNMLAEDQVIQPLYGMEQRFAIYKDIQQLLGLTSPAYLADPDDPETQQKIAQRQQQEQEAQAAQASAVGAQVQLAAASEARQSIEGKRKLDLEQQKLLETARKNDAAQSLDEREHLWDRYVDQQEIELERKQERGVSI